MTWSMKHSTSCSHRESSSSWFEIWVSWLRRAMSSGACFLMRDSDRLSTWLCHEVDTREVFALARRAYSREKSCVKFRPVVRTGAVSLEAGEGFPRAPLCHAPLPWSRDRVAEALSLLAHCQMRRHCLSRRAPDPGLSRRLYN